LAIFKIVQNMSINDDVIVIIMAGGLGKRMESDIPKVLHEIGNQPMLYRVITQARQLSPHKILIVVGQYRSIIESTLKMYTTLDDIEFIDQPKALGTGHAIMCCNDYLQNCPDKKVLILSGDVPLITSKTMNDMIDNLHKVKIMVAIFDNSHGYGRIIEKNGLFDKITEEKDCSNDEKNIKKVNCGIYAFDSCTLCKYLPSITNNNSQQEYYLTDIIEIIKNKENIIVDMYEIDTENHIEICGVNTKNQLIELNQRYNKINK